LENELIEMFKGYCFHFHKSAAQDDYPFFTIRNGIYIKMSSDSVQRFVEKYGESQMSVAFNPSYTSSPISSHPSYAPVYGWNATGNGHPMA